MHQFGLRYHKMAADKLVHILGPSYIKHLILIWVFFRLQSSMRLTPDYPHIWPNLARFLDDNPKLTTEIQNSHQSVEHRKSLDLLNNYFDQFDTVPDDSKTDRVYNIIKGHFANRHRYMPILTLRFFNKECSLQLLNRRIYRYMNKLDLPQIKIQSDPADQENSNENDHAHYFFSGLDIF